MKDNVTWISFERSYLKRITEVDLYARVGYLVNSITEQTIEYTIDLRTDKNRVFMNCYYRAVNSEGIAMCIEKSLPLEVWTVDHEEDILNFDPYISGFTSNTLIAGKVLIENMIK